MKVDFKKTQSSYKAKQDKFTIVDVPAMQYLMVDGQGFGEEFTVAISALYPVAYTLKFMSKVDLERDYVVPPLEGLWWADDMEFFTSRQDKSQWRWTLMLMVPDWIKDDRFMAAKEIVGIKKAGLQSLEKIRLQSLEEGTCVQTLHVGPYDEEGPILEKMHKDFIPAAGYRMVKKHHEVYFSDFRKVAPEKLRTILRQPIRKVE